MDQLAQPDLNFEGEITSEAVKEMDGKLEAIEKDMQERKSGSQDWQFCRMNWLSQIGYARLRLHAIVAKLKYGVESHRAEEDRKCMSIMLCILRDYEVARKIDFWKPDYAERQ